MKEGYLMVRKRILGIGLVISIIFNIFVSNESVACSVENSKVIGDDVVNDDMKVSDSEDVNSMLNALSSGNLSDTITVDSIGNLQSEHNYQNDTDKYWIYTVDCAGELKVKFSDETEVENGSDYIYIYDKYDNQIGKYTGTQLAGKTVSVPYNTIKIRLQSDSSNTSYGFAVDSIVTLDSITVTTLPTITTYLVEESPEYDGIIITGNYSDGSSIVISDGYSFSNIDKTTTGTKTVTVTYSGLTTTLI